MPSRLSGAQVHKLPQSDCGYNQEGTLHDNIYTNIHKHIHYIYVYKYIYIYIYIYIMLR